MNTRHTRLSALILTLCFAGTLLAACQPVQIPSVQAQGAAHPEVELFTITMAPGEVLELGALGANPSREESFLHAVQGKELAYYNDDSERFLLFFSEDTVSMPPDFVPTEGKDALTADMEAFFGEYEISGHSELISYEISGDYATRTLHAWDTLVPKAGGETITASGSCVAGWKLIDGEWQIVWEIWNSEPLPQP
jgi:ketosteroid isomerase-like protein